MKNKIIMGTRGSRLARAQSEKYLDLLKKKYPEMDIELKIITTKGDRDQKTSLADFPERGIFTKSIEEALINHDIDFAVHSLKDLPSKLPKGLQLIDKPPLREDFRDVLLSMIPIDQFPEEPVIGTGSLRRKVLAKEIFKDAVFKDIRGNVDTRIDKLKNGAYDAIILAVAGLKRLGITNEYLKNNGIHAFYFDSEKEFIPAPTQGILGIEIRSEDEALNTLLSDVGDTATAFQALGERAFLGALEGNCKVPIGSLCLVKNNLAKIIGLYGSEDGHFRKGETEWIEVNAIEEEALKLADSLKKPGKVYLTGAGCGDPDLITRKALKAIKKADVIVYDALIDSVLLEERKEDAELLYVGKRSKNHTLSQDGINKVLVDKAREGKEVVRLKGGDPYVFGRGGEEAEYLSKYNIPFEIIPGITSAIAGPAYSGIPVTHRDATQSFMVLTGHMKEDGKDHDWKNLAGYDGTLIFLMGVRNLESIIGNLLLNGKNPETPVAFIENATTPEQRVITGSLNNAVEVARENVLSAPALIVIGEVVKYSDKLRPNSEGYPLFGKKILVTRARSQASELSSRIRALGGQAIEFPTILIEENPEELQLLKEQMRDLSDYTHLVFTSVNTVEIFFKALHELGLDSRQLSGLTIGAIGRATARKLNEYGIRADFIPKVFRAESLVQAIEPTLNAYSKILLPRSADARTYLVDALRDQAEIVEFPIYQTKPDLSNYEIIKEKLNRNEIDAVTFTSSSTVKNFAKAFSPDEMKDVACFSIGPVTSQTLKECDLQTTAEASVYTTDGLVESLKNYYASDQIKKK